MSRKAGDTEKSRTAPTENTALRAPLGQEREGGEESNDVTDHCVTPHPESVPHSARVKGRLSEERLLECTLEALFKLNESLEGLEKLTESRCWKHDGVAPPSNVFCDLKKTAPLVFLEVEEEHFPLVSHFFRGYRL